MGSFKRKALEVAADKERAAKKQRLAEDPLLERYTTDVLHLVGNEVLPPLVREKKRGSASCWGLLEEGFSKYTVGFADQIICNECLASPATLKNAEFSYGSDHSTSSVVSHIRVYHPKKFKQHQLADQIKVGKS